MAIVAYASSLVNKNILTLTNTINFDPKSPSVSFLCMKCKTPGHMTLIYKEILPVLIFHFENGTDNKCKVLL